MEQRVRSLDLNSQYFNKPVARHVYEFCVLIALILLIVGGLGTYHGKGILHTVSYGTAALAVLLLGKVAPRLVLPTWKLWMGFGNILAMVITPVVMTTLWFVMFVPISLLVKALRIEIMDMGFKKPVDSYWIRRDPKKDDFQLLKRQF